MSVQTCKWALLLYRIPLFTSLNWVTYFWVPTCRPLNLLIVLQKNFIASHKPCLLLGLLRDCAKCGRVWQVSTRRTSRTLQVIRGLYSQRNSFTNRPDIYWSSIQTQLASLCKYKLNKNKIKCTEKSYFLVCRLGIFAILGRSRSAAGSFRNVSESEHFPGWSLSGRFHLQF